MSWYEYAMDYANRLAGRSGRPLSDKEQTEIEKVLSFIGRLHAKADSTDCLYDIFENGYCYYFATMLDTAFPGMGEVVWIRNRGHIVMNGINIFAQFLGQLMHIGRCPTRIKKSA